jgi:kynurenine formamidase
MSEGKQRTLLQTASERLAAIKDTILLKPAHFHFPKFDHLPKVEGQPQGCCWGLFDTRIKKDEIGTLNLLTADVVRRAASEIRTGRHVQLDWELSGNVQHPGFGRKKFEHKVLDKRASSDGRHAGFDDEISLNTQSGSQWDSLKHYAHQKTQMYYNGLSHDVAGATDTNGIHRWCERGGIVGRGVLIDWLSWYERKHGDPPSAVSAHEITVEDLEACLRWQATVTRPGDILLVRTGYTRWHNYASPAERQRGTVEKTMAIGLQSSETMVRWLYDRHFAAVVSDTLALEAWPPSKENEWKLHEWLLVQWGTPIGELWDLETLSKICNKEKRWTFFLTSAPLHVRGGVGSPPGAIAVF